MIACPAYLKTIILNLKELMQKEHKPAILIRTFSHPSLCITGNKIKANTQTQEKKAET